MKFLAVASTLLLAGTALAAPGTALRRERALAKRAGRKSNPLIRPTLSEEEEKSLNITNDSTSTNWAGAVLIGSSFTSVTGTFTAPTPSTAGSGSAWVGIDGDTCQSAILQTGIDWTKSGSSVTYDAWYEWYPDYAYDFSASSIPISAGDSITVTVTATSKTGGTATIVNNSKGKTVSHTFSNEAREGSLCETNAEWIIEDFESSGSQVQFADFGTVTFTGASAKEGSSTVGTTGATVIDMINSKKTVIVDCSLTGSSGVTCTYV